MGKELCSVCKIIYYNKMIEHAPVWMRSPSEISVKEAACVTGGDFTVLEKTPRQARGFDGGDSVVPAAEAPVFVRAEAVLVPFFVSGAEDCLADKHGDQGNDGTYKHKMHARLLFCRFLRQDVVCFPLPQDDLPVARFRAFAALGETAAFAQDRQYLAEAVVQFQHIDGAFQQPTSS